MQTIRKNCFLLLAVSLCFLGSSGGASGSGSTLHTADSLFSIGRYPEADVLYRSYYQKHEKFNPDLLLRLAFLAEKADNPARSLYYLSILAEKQPTRLLLEKMSLVASQQNLTGYEFNDFSYFLIFYRRFGGYIPILLLTLGIYVVAVMIIKVRQKERIQNRHKWTTVAYLLALLALLNIPANYKSGIIRGQLVYVRAFPSAAAPVVETLRQGHRLTVIGRRDRWQRIIWKGKVVFVRDSDIWII